MKNFFKKVLVNTFLEVDSRLTRRLNARGLVVLGVGAVIGTDIFILPGHEAVQHAGPAVVILFLLAAIASDTVGMAYVEFPSAMPVAGSAYSSGSVIYGEIVGRVIGWGLLLEYSLAASAEATGFASYSNNNILAPIGIHLSKAPEAGLTEGGVTNLSVVLIVLIVALILYQGANLSKRVENIAVIIKIVIIILFIVIRLFYIKAENYVLFCPEKFRTPPLGMGGISTAAATVFSAFTGFDALVANSTETRDPVKNVVKGIMGTIIIVISLYVSFPLVLAEAINYKRLNVDDPVAYALKVVGLTAWNKLITVEALVGIFTAMITMPLGGSGLLYALGRDGLLSDSMGSVHAKKMTPGHVVVVSTIVAAIFAGLVPLMELASLTDTGTLIAFALISLGTIPFRHRKDTVNNGFKMSFYPILSIIPGLLSVYFIRTPPKMTRIMVGIWLIAGIAAYVTYGVRHSKLQKQ